MLFSISLQFVFISRNVNMAFIILMFNIYSFIDQIIPSLDIISTVIPEGNLSTIHCNTLRVLIQLLLGQALVLLRVA